MKKIAAGCSKTPSSKAAASADRRRYPPHFVEPFARTIDLGERKIPSSASDLWKFHRYVEDLNDARTKLADFFSSLLGKPTA
jgi:hypothetical protein